MPVVDGKKFAYTPAGKRAAAAARRKGGQAPATGGGEGEVIINPYPPQQANPDKVKTKGDLLAGNLGNTIKNMGGGY